MPKATIRRGKLTIPLSAEIREMLNLRDGDELELTTEGGRIVLTLVAEEPLPSEVEALDEAEKELAQGKTRRLDDVIHGLGRKVKQPSRASTRADTGSRPVAHRDRSSRNEARAAQRRYQTAEREASRCVPAPRRSMAELFFQVKADLDTVLIADITRRTSTTY